MNRVPRWVFIVVLLCLSLWAYRGLRFGAFHDDLLDYQQFLEERTKVKTDREFFWRVVSFDRVRASDAKVNFLFRPGLFTLLAAEDIWAREFPPLAGWISLFLHVLCVLTLFLLLSRYASGWLAFFVTAIFAIYSQGSFMILWRMIVPYTIALLTFVAGSWLLFKVERGTVVGRAIGAGILFLISAFFNETAAFWIPAGGLAIWWMSRKSGFEKSYLLAFLIPPVVFFSVSLLDLVLRAPEGGLFSHYFAPFSGGTGPAYFLVLSVVRFLQSVGYYTLPFFVPQGASLSVADSQVVHLILGAALLSLALWVLRRNLASFRDGDRSVLFWFLLLGYPFWIILMVGIFRVSTRGYFYLGASSYYCYTVAFFLCLVLGVLLARVLPRGFRGAQRWWLLIVFILMANQLLFSYGRLQKNIWRLVPAQRERTVLLSRAVGLLGDDRCLLWSNEYFRSDAPLAPIYLYRRSCDVRKGTPMSLDELKRQLGTR